MRKSGRAKPRNIYIIFAKTHVNGAFHRSDPALLAMLMHFIDVFVAYCILMWESWREEWIIIPRVSLTRKCASADDFSGLNINLMSNPALWSRSRMYLLYQLKNPVAGQIRVNYLVGSEVPSKKGRSRALRPQTKKSLKKLITLNLWKVQDGYSQILIELNFIIYRKVP